jgi:hypothetical protein
MSDSSDESSSDDNEFYVDDPQNNIKWDTTSKPYKSEMVYRDDLYTYVSVLPKLTEDQEDDMSRLGVMIRDILSLLQNKKNLKETGAWILEHALQLIGKSTNQSVIIIKNKSCFINKAFCITIAIQKGVFLNLFVSQS